MPNVKGPERTLREMKVYAIILLILSMNVPSYHELAESGTFYYILGGNVFVLTIWYANSVWRIDLEEERGATGRIPTAARSFFVSMLYLALMCVVLVTASFGILGAGFGGALSMVAVVRSESRARA